jgi:hypothetical protein
MSEMSTIDLIQSAAIVFSFIMTFVQLYLYLKEKRISIVTSISERNDALLNDLITHAASIKKLDKPFKAEARGYLADPRVSIMYRIINFFDEMFYYYRQGFLSKQAWNLYQVTMNRLLGSEFAKTFWAHVRNEYNEDFQACVEKNLQQTMT